MNELDIKYSEKKKFEAGLAQGEAKRNNEIARAMKAEGLSAELICRMTGLTEEQLKELK